MRTARSLPAHVIGRVVGSSLLVCLFSVAIAPVVGQEWTVTVQKETGESSGRYHRTNETRTWDPTKTAIIVCDMWDAHHGLNAVRRVQELAPRINAVLHAARQRGVTVIHAPSSCVKAYADHPARMRTVLMPKLKDLPPAINEWCSKIPIEDRAVYPIDQSDGGEDDDAVEHQQWARQLKALGREPRHPWQRQIDSVEISGERDYISDQGDEIWSILKANHIQQVILCGVHTNMCVLGRPFGLRQMVKNKMPVVLMRDLTDTMYNPKSSPYVSHFSGTDLIIDYIERHICPTITSQIFLPNEDHFRFRNDRRLHVAIVMSEDEYKTRETLTQFANQWLRQDYRVSLVYGNNEIRNDIPGLEHLQDVDLLILSSRRRVLPPEQLKWFRSYLNLGKPLIALRTASHSFHLRNQDPPEGFADWPTFDADALGGSYHGHYPNSDAAQVQLVKTARGHAILNGVDVDQFPGGGSLYQTAPLAPGAFLLAQGTIEKAEAPEPVAWTYTRANGGRTFYAALGHRADFANPVFVRILRNAVAWSLGQQPPTDPQTQEHPTASESAVKTP